jgi:hypothetical protein
MNMHSNVAMNHQAMGQQVGCESMQQSMPKSPDGIVSLPVAALQAFAVLSREIGDLRERLEPIVEPYPDTFEKQTGLSAVEASAVVSLRQLIEAINEKATYVRQITAAVRV